MESTVSNQIVEILDALCEKFGIAIDWTSQNVLPYAQELMKKVVRYEIWTSIAWIIVLGIAAGICWFIVWRISKKNELDFGKAYLDGMETIAMFFIVVGIFLTLVFIIITSLQIFDIITCLTFPEKIIFNMIQSMM